MQFIYAQQIKRNCSPKLNLSDLDGSEVFVKFWVQWWEFINGAVESAVVMTQDLTEEEGGKWYVHNYALNTQTRQLLKITHIPN